MKIGKLKNLFYVSDVDFMKMAPLDFSDVFHKRSAFGLLKWALGGEF